MEIVKDFEAFDERQIGVANELAKAVGLALSHLALTPKELKETLATVVFSVCNVLDGTSVVERDGVPLVPFLTFEETEGSGRLITSGSSSFLHEHAHAAVDEFLKSRA